MTNNDPAEIQAGLAHLSRGNFSDAAIIFEKVLSANPKNHDALHYLGVIAFQTGHIDKAIALFEATLQLNPNSADAQSNFGSALFAAGQTLAAEQATRRAIELSRQNATVHFNLGNILFVQKKFREAANSYKTAVSLRADYPEALCNLGAAYRELENLGAATSYFDKALQARPNYADAAYNLANAYRDAGRLTDAERLIRHAIDLNPDNPKAHNSLGNILSESGQSDLAVTAFKHASALDPSSMPMASNVLSCLQYVSGVDGPTLAEAHAKWVRQFKAHTTIVLPKILDQNFDKPLRVGFVSPDFGSHPCGILSVRMFENIDPTQIQAVIFSTRRPEREDDYSRRIEKVTDWHRVANLADGELATAISAANVDILIDMSGHTSGHRLGVFLRKPAPLQISWLGYVGTTGLPTMDYIIADSWHAPPNESTYGPEQFLRLDDGYVCFDPPSNVGEVSSLPALSNQWITFGSLNNATKLNEEVIESYSSILRRIERSRLILQFRGLDDAGVVARLHSRFGACGVEQGRIDIRGYAKRQKFLATYNEIDIALDTFPYSGGLTTCEALWMGVPVVTFPGQTFAGRHAASHLSNAGVPDFVAPDRSEFENLAVAKAQNIESLAILRRGLRDRLLASPLCDGPRFARSFTKALKQAWNAYCNPKR